MRSIPLTFCAAAAAVLMAAPAPATAAPAGDDRPGTVSVTPSTTAPGGRVELWTDACGTSRGAKARSEAFTGEAHFRPADEQGLFAEAHIRADAAPRSYEVRVVCENGRGRATGTLTVVHHTRPSPAAPVKAGGGGSADLAEEGGASQGPGTRHAVTGLVLAAVAAGAFALRGARRRRGPSGT